MANLMDETQLERYAAQLEEDAADREVSELFAELKAAEGVSYELEYRITHAVGYLYACINATVEL